MTSRKSVLPFVETMITQVCNLSCQGCTNYSDLKHSGYVTWEQGRAWLEPWTHRLEIADFGIMGGEPMINPQVREWLAGVRRLLPHAQIRFTTNGLLLHKNRDLIDLCQELGNVVFKITVHVDDQLLENEIVHVMTGRTWEPVIEHGIARWRSSNDLRFQINRPQQFVPPFQNGFANMAPWRSDPQAAFSRCIQQTCPLLYKDRIYKCSTSALLVDTLERFNRPNWDHWQPYIDKGISIHDDDSMLASFVAAFGRPGKICGQCPDTSAPPINHLDTVTFNRS